MNKISLILRIASIAAALLAGVAWYLTNGKLEEKQAEIQNRQAAETRLRADLSDARDQIASLESDLNTSRSELAQAKQRATEFQDQYFLSTQEIARLQNQIEEDQRLLANATRDNEQLRQEIVTVKNAPLPDRDRTAEITAYQRKIADLESEIGDLQGRLAGAPTPAPTRQSAPDPSPPQDLPGIMATIAALKPDLGLVVIDRGSPSGILPDQEFTVLYNGIEVGSMRVTVANELGSVGALISSTVGFESLNIGDSIWLIQ